jgi:hypothetical protein
MLPRVTSNCKGLLITNLANRSGTRSHFGTPRKTAGISPLACNSSVRSLPSLVIIPITVASPARAAMMSSPSGRAKHEVIGAFCVLLAVGGLAPSSTQASCGHNVASSVSRVIADSLTELELEGSLGVGPTDPAPAGPHRQQPCSGPACSKGRTLPHAPAPSSPVRSDTWCCTTAALYWGGPDPGDLLADLATSHPQHSMSSLERPPRPFHFPALT